MLSSEPGCSHQHDVSVFLCKSAHLISADAHPLLLEPQGRMVMDVLNHMLQGLRLLQPAMAAASACPDKK